MPCQIATVDLETAAKEAAGNWSTFECFAWSRASDLDDAEQWCIMYTHHRDSGLLDHSNAAAIEGELEPFMEDGDPDVVPEHHSHWAVGWIDGFSIRVYRNGHITRAFRRYHELTQRLDEYPLLDEEHYSRLEFDATLENVTDAAWRLKDNIHLPDEWESDVYHWFSENDPGAVENTSDQGGYPSEEQLQAAFAALEYRLVDA
jgi:hypothetical protein